MFGEYTPLMKAGLLQRRIATGKARLCPELGLKSGVRTALSSGRKIRCFGRPHRVKRMACKLGAKLVSSNTRTVAKRLSKWWNNHDTYVGAYC
ncbi:hypothetical protein [Vibrio cholerae]|uniref:hypothetical protein n=1 Tax=Vibrio cholerae TaxID=666 RepID=UPI000AF4E8E7|nr:hypothetical protein [Vibrio cholerae]